MSNSGAIGCECNDYSLLTAKTGIGTLTTANPNLDGSGSLVTIFTATAANGTRIKSIIIKAAEATLTGMVRLFVRNPAGTVTALYREIPIAENPTLVSTPTPPPILPMLEFDLVDELILEQGARLLASTQIGERINVFAEALEISYPEELPPGCCNFVQTATITGTGILSAANPNLDGTGTIVPVFTATPPAPLSSNGSTVKAITIAALQGTHPGMIRFFISPPGTPAYTLLMEVMVPETAQGGFIPSFKVAMKEGYHLQEDYVIGASTENGESFAVTVEGTSWSYPI